MVTGSCYKIEAAGKKFLVDCGLFQGSLTEEMLNYDDFPFDISSIDFDENTVQYAENYTIVDYSNNFAKSMFRMNGSGYLANGNISWDTNGNITMKDISVQSGNICPLKIISQESKSSVKVTSKNIDILNITNDSVSINGTLTTKSD